MNKMLSTDYRTSLMFKPLCSGTALFLLLLVLSLPLHCEEWTVTDGMINISWHQPDNLVNLWGYRLDISNGAVCLFSEYYEGVTPPADIKLRYDDNRDLLMTVWSIGMAGEFGGRVVGIIHFILPNIEAPKEVVVQ